MLDAAFTQPLKDRPLRCLALIPQRIVDKAALLVLRRQSRRAAQVCLIGKYHHKLSLLAIGCALHHPRRDLRRDFSRRWSGGRRPRQHREQHTREAKSEAHGYPGRKKNAARKSVHGIGVARRHLVTTLNQSERKADVIAPKSSSSFSSESWRSEETEGEEVAED